MASKMIVLLFSLVLVLSVPAKAERSIHITVERYQQLPNLLMFEILGPNPVDRLVLDCQSFLHGLTFYQENHPKHPDPSYHFYLYEPECHEIHHFIVNTLEYGKKGEKACLEILPQSNEYFLYSGTSCSP